MFFLVLYKFVYDINDVATIHDTNLALKKLFVDEGLESEDVPFKKTINDLTSVDEVIMWLGSNGVFFNALYTKKSGSDTIFVYKDAVSALNFLEMIDFPQLKQARVAKSNPTYNQTCNINNPGYGALWKYRISNTLPFACMDEYSSSTRSTKPFGPPSNTSKYFFETPPFDTNLKGNALNVLSLSFLLKKTLCRGIFRGYILRLHYLKSLPLKIYILRENFGRAACSTCYCSLIIIIVIL